ncbi:Rieske 2Fe-2S domain-containing protein [Sediminibacterium sp.]|uniref:Rieske (2Fe-2S) protein n=1 Tax=Sediminibacterium sp. TaxID=1917865 RepID=UPI0025D2FEC8|nr:Rieske 2Fe-2S domain-containing protein [Sediminibacterium sp.]MDP3393320.1 Rieske 2Fe-2S domain-containing protein [Sediminibacterium sp.]MDP3567922.1 Rieske 2Fe-2S domain-containing protein [Sediminibacterium sp.]
MNRKEFIVKSCTACIGATALSAIVSSCAATQFANGKMTKDGILIDVNEFALKGKDKYRLYIVVRNEELVFPICVYRFSDTDYAALWMQCAHQGAELNVAGDYLQCPAHGSEYSNRGKVTNGPADRDLRTFPVMLNNNQIFIDLRKV